MLTICSLIPDTESRNSVSCVRAFLLIMYYFIGTIMCRLYDIFIIRSNNHKHICAWPHIHMYTSIFSSSRTLLYSVSPHSLSSHVFIVCIQFLAFLNLFNFQIGVQSVNNMYEVTLQFYKKHLTYKEIMCLLY